MPAASFAPIGALLRSLHQRFGFLKHVAAVEDHPQTIDPGFFIQVVQLAGQQLLPPILHTQV